MTLTKEIAEALEPLAMCDGCVGTGVVYGPAAGDCADCGGTGGGKEAVALASAISRALDSEREAGETRREHLDLAMAALIFAEHDPGLLHFWIGAAKHDLREAGADAARAPQKWIDGMRSAARVLLAPTSTDPRIPPSQFAAEAVTAMVPPGAETPAKSDDSGARSVLEGT